MYVAILEKILVVFAMRMAGTQNNANKPSKTNIVSILRFVTFGI
jgi:hypothetical protein